MQISINVTTDTLSAALASLGEAYADLSPLYQDWGEFLVESTRQNFREGTSPDGTAWAPRSQTTLDAYAARGETPKGGPLVGVSRALSTTISYELEPNGLTWGSNMIQAAVMQFGASQGEFGRTSRNGPIPWGDIPARPFLGIGPDDETALIEIAEDYLRDAAAP